MADRFSEDCKVNIAQDYMSATLYLDPPENSIAYTVEELTDFLRHNGVNSGIIFSALENMVQDNVYHKDVIVARGVEAVDGKDGYYDFFFESEHLKHPVIRSDGSVDYQSMNAVHSVKSGELLAEYHKAVQGVHGYDVQGREFRAKPGKELPKLKGTGFDYDEYKENYISNTEGRVEYNNYMLYVRDVYEHKGDLDLMTGKLDFRGDVIIHGNVCAGTMVRASKTITVDGNVEAATLISGGDMILKKGMQGGKKARIVCGGDLMASFIEFTEIECKGRVEANIVMNCRINAGKDIVISGKKGAVVGGNAYAVGTISSTFLGNAAGHRTIASVGITQDLEERNHLLSVKLEGAMKSVQQTEEEITRNSDYRISSERKEVREARLSQLKRRKLRDERLVSHIKEELEKIGNIMEIGSNAKITVSNTAFPSVVIRIGDKEKVLESEVRGMEFYRESPMQGISMRTAQES